MGGEVETLESLLQTVASKALEIKHRGEDRPPSAWSGAGGIVIPSSRRHSFNSPSCEMLSSASSRRGGTGGSFCALSHFTTHLM